MSPGFLAGLFRRQRQAGDGNGDRSEPAKKHTSRGEESDERLVSLRCAEAREEERRRMAVDLHDGPIQQLVNLVLRLDMAEKALPADAANTRAEFANIRQFARGILQDMRRFMFELRPASLDEFSLLPVLRQYIQDFRTQYSIPVELRLSDSDWSLGRDVEVNLFRIVQEALTNVRKHAKASRVDVALERQDSTVTAIIADDGQGFDVASVRARAQQEKKLGLSSMEDRARALGGGLQVSSRSGQTEVRVTIPLARDKATPDHG